MMLPIMTYQNTVYFSPAMQFYMTETIKRPLLRAIQILIDPQESRLAKLKALKTLWRVYESIKRLPEPTKDNTWHPNSHNLIDLRDWLKEVCHLDNTRTNLIVRIINSIIILYDSDPPWRWIMDKTREKGMAMEWKPPGWNDTWKKTYSWWEKDEKDLVCNKV